MSYLGCVLDDNKPSLDQPNTGFPWDGLDGIWFERLSPVVKEMDGIQSEIKSMIKLGK